MFNLSYYITVLVISLADRVGGNLVRAFMMEQRGALILALCASVCVSKDGGSLSVSEGQAAIQVNEGISPSMLQVQDQHVDQESDLVVHRLHVGEGHPVNAALFGVGDDWTLGADTWQNATQLDGIKVGTVAALCASGHCE